MALSGRAGQKLELAQGLRAERTHRELRLSAASGSDANESPTHPPPVYQGTIPGEIDAPAFGLHLHLAVSASGEPGKEEGMAASRLVKLRNWKPGDRVTLRYSSGPRKVKEVLERLRVTGTSRALWPVLEMDGRIVWMRGAELQPEPGIAIQVRFT
jgi:tRNA(Ile)-lysidine synthase